MILGLSSDTKIAVGRIGGTSRKDECGFARMRSHCFVVHSIRLRQLPLLSHKDEKMPLVTSRVWLEFLEAEPRREFRLVDQGPVRWAQLGDAQILVGDISQKLGRPPDHGMAPKRQVCKGHPGHEMIVLTECLKRHHLEGLGHLGDFHLPKKAQGDIEHRQGVSR